jgi:hypothetical protein
MKTKVPFKLHTLGDLLAWPPKKTGIRVTKSRGCLTLRWGHWKHAPYDIPLSDLQTERGILRWTYHLAGKTWITREMLDDFMRTALEVSGINIHAESKLKPS